MTARLETVQPAFCLCWAAILTRSSSPAARVTGSPSPPRSALLCGTWEWHRSRSRTRPHTRTSVNPGPGQRAQPVGLISGSVVGRRWGRCEGSRGSGDEGRLGGKSGRRSGQTGRLHWSSGVTRNYLILYCERNKKLKKRWSRSFFTL